MDSGARNTAAVAAAAIAGVVVAAVGGRLAYTETARADYADYERKAQEAINDPALRAAWARKLEAIDEKRRKGEADWGDCENISEEERTGHEQWLEYEKTMPWHLPSKPIYSAEDACYNRKLARQEQSNEMAEMEKDALGTYESWAVEQSGIDKHHRWTRYPKELVERVMKGERGLMLGKFWNYIL